jgi:hypothetical protein
MRPAGRAQFVSFNFTNALICAVVSSALAPAADRSGAGAGAVARGGDGSRQDAEQAAGRKLTGQERGGGAGGLEIDGAALQDGVRRTALRARSGAGSRRRARCCARRCGSRIGGGTGAGGRRSPQRGGQRRAELRVHACQRLLVGDARQTGRLIRQSAGQYRRERVRIAELLIPTLLLKLPVLILLPK